MNFLKIKIKNNVGVGLDVTPPKTIKSWNKVWSFFVITKMSTWDKMTKCSNRTCCTKTNALSGTLIKMEIVQQGMSSYAH